MAPVARMLADGRRLHLNHGPIDLVIGAEGPASDIARAYRQATERFQSVLDVLVAELPLLRTEIGQNRLGLSGSIARRMESAVQPHWRSRVTPMAAVAGAVADEILDALLADTQLRRAFVNNGGDIALHLADGEAFSVASPAGLVRIEAASAARGIATSGWKGRSFSLGIADAVTVLAHKACVADIAATLIANAVDLPGSPKVQRQAACEIAPDSDLRDRLVTVDVAPLMHDEIATALAAGQTEAQRLFDCGFISGASLLLQGEARFLENSGIDRAISSAQRGLSAEIQ